MRTIPYSVALNGLTPKHVRDAFKRFTWPSSKTLASWVRWEGVTPTAIVDLYTKAKANLRERTITDIAAPRVWWHLCSLWNAKRMSTVRERFQPTAEQYDDMRMLSKESEEALDVFVTLLVIHLLSPGSPLQRLRAIGNKYLLVEETPEQVEARERAEAREQATNAGARALIASARRDAGRVYLDARLLLGSVLIQKNEYFRIRCGDLVATVKRAKLDEAASILLAFPSLYAWIEALPKDLPGSPLPGSAQLCIRWSRGNGRTGGLNLRYVEVEYNFGRPPKILPTVIHDSWCTVIEIPHDIPNVRDNDMEAASKARLLVWQQRLRDAKEEGT